MSKIKEKIPCDHCKKKIHAREKTKVVGSLELHYLWCATCKSVYPAYVQNDETRQIEKKIQRLRKEIDNLQNCPDREIKMERSAELYREILQLQSFSKVVTKELVRKHIKLFEGIGNRIVYR